MMQPGPRVRFAPSPTGELHVGNARTALFNWLFAKRYGGKFILRIEDTDQERTSKACEKNLMEDLHWLSMDWDEGPGKSGEFGPYHQIERLDIYDTYLEKLVAAERVYPCYCTEEELQAERTDLISMKMMPRYMGKCRSLTHETRKKLEMEGRKPTFRFKVAKGQIEFNDLIRGAMKFEGESIGDFIIVRSSGIPAYNFAVVIDDHLMKITHVIRGEDHLSNTAIQILLYNALGFSPPVFAHHSLILGKDRTKLSKRHGSVSVREFREKGMLPEALLNYLALLGSSLESGREVASIREIIEMFTLDRAGKSGSIFDEDKLKWMNALYIRHYDVGELAALLVPFIRKAGYDPDQLESGWFHRIVDAVRDNLVTLADFGDYLGMFIGDRYHMCPDAASLIKQDNARTVIAALQNTLKNLNVADDGDLYGEVITKLRKETGLKGRDLLMPVRAAITGRTSGPELGKIFAILGKESIYKRVSEALA